MPTKAAKYYVCWRANCAFKTDKRKAIYTHLVRTHSERKEDYECEYCATVFQNEAVIERHLQEIHPSQPFTYTCVSRIENVINKCAKLGQEYRRSSLTENDVKIHNTDVKFEALSPGKDVNIKVENGTDGAMLENDSVEKRTDADLRQRTKASVNASLNSIAKHVMNNGGESGEVEGDVDVCNSQPDIQDDDDDLTTHISKPSGLKIKLNLKKITEFCKDGDQRESSTSPPHLEPEFDVKSSCDDISAMPPDIVNAKSSTCGVAIREKASKYFDKLEVYHNTDEFGRRCCPFCPYKTTKNTIRVHLSGIHKIHFVKCSLCDYKSAFPHQITQHGLKFHKTTNLNVIQLSKESREKVIARLPKSPEFEQQLLANKRLAEEAGQRPEPIIEIDQSNCSFIDDVMSSDSGSPSEEEDNAVADVGQTDDPRSFKAPKCQTSKTDYYDIQINNGVYLYCCKLCPFQTPVRATIYTHKYRHEEKAYRCGYCEFTSSPRSNVVHHCRSKHKHRTIKVLDAGEVAMDVTGGGNRADAAHKKGAADMVSIKQEPVENRDSSDSSSRLSTSTDHGASCSPARKNQHATQNSTKTSPTIIKVPEFKRSFTSGVCNSVAKTDDAKKRKAFNQAQAGYKLSLNKLYRINPVGSPKFLCAKCPYACDTHPKMKHHLYRHRPQQYKCPYCDHRKYPRSYVLRHVRDTHRGKPLRVIDLSKDNESADVLETSDDVTDDVDDQDDTMETENQNETDIDVDDSMNLYIKQELKQFEDISNNNANDKAIPPLESALPAQSTPMIKSEPLDQDYISDVDNCPPDRVSRNSVTDDDVITKTPPIKTLADKLQLNLSKELNSDRMFASESPDVSPNFSETVYTSTPLIESIINNGQFPASPNNGQFPASPKPQTKNFDKKKSVKDYRVNSVPGQGPRYVCNKCGYGTENYKTIHNHMYRHESQRYQCPYCGYRRSPRSFVENHIREVHKGNPVIVTELTDDVDTDAPQGSPRQCVGSNKRKSPFSSLLTPPGKKPNPDNSASKPGKLPVKWPAPKPASKVLSTSDGALTPQLKIPVKQKNFTSSLDSQDETSVTSNFIESSSAEEESYAVDNASETAPLLLNQSTPVYPDDTGLPTGNQSPPIRFKEGSRTTFKTMYKCVFDPETCNHISKDKSKMKQHLFMHVEYKPWTCDYCDMTASQSSHIKNHVRMEHPNVSDMSFKYKKHNYLEKHIDGFLGKGLFTVPVSEYRRIMDLKGNTKTTQKCTFARDTAGFILCPYCDYRTKSGGMTDHVKMKHMQPRFKCHWCDYRAFYRSEVRKHHRKERSHAHLEFKTQELDLSQPPLYARDDTLEDSTSMYLDSNDIDAAEEVSLNDSCEDYPDLPGDSDDDSADVDDDEDLDVEGDEDISSNVSSLGQDGHVLAAQTMLSDSKGLNSSADNKETFVDVKHENNELGHGSVGEKLMTDTRMVHNVEKDVDVSMKIVKIPKLGHGKSTCISNKFQCGYCSFSANLRVKVKMHCSKRHPDKILKVLEPSAIRSAEAVRESSHNITRVDVNDWKGTKFELDLKKAGVSKLNLASLFPKCKRIKVEDDIPSDNDDDEHDMESKEGTGTPEYQQTQLVIPFKKATVPNNIEIPAARTSQKSPDREPEFKVPLTPSPVIKTADKIQAAKKHHSNTESCISNERFTENDTDINTCVDKDSLSISDETNITDDNVTKKSDTEEKFNLSSASSRESTSNDNESHDDADIIVEPLVTTESCVTVDIYSCAKDVGNEECSDKVSEGECRHSKDDFETNELSQSSFTEACETTGHGAEHCSVESDTESSLVVLTTVPNFTPVVLEHETNDNIELEIHDTTHNIDTVSAKANVLDEADDVSFQEGGMPDASEGLADEVDEFKETEYGHGDVEKNHQDVEESQINIGILS